MHAYHVNRVSRFLLWPRRPVIGRRKVHHSRRGYAPASDWFVNIAALIALALLLWLINSVIESTLAPTSPHIAPGSGFLDQGWTILNRTVTGARM